MIAYLYVIFCPLLNSSFDYQHYHGYDNAGLRKQKNKHTLGSSLCFHDVSLSKYVHDWHYKRSIGSIDLVESWICLSTNGTSISNSYCTKCSQKRYWAKFIFSLYSLRYYLCFSDYQRKWTPYY